MAAITGKVKWFNDQKGFGFIEGEGGQDVFVHHTSIAADGFRTLKEGEVVEYETEPGPKGLKATVVRRSEAATQESTRAPRAAHFLAGRDS